MGIYEHEVKARMDTILDCFSGADGGVSFVKLKTQMEKFAKEADQGGYSSQEVCSILIRFARLIEVVNKE